MHACPWIIQKLLFWKTVSVSCSILIYQVWNSEEQSHSSKTFSPDEFFNHFLHISFKNRFNYFFQWKDAPIFYETSVGWSQFTNVSPHTQLMIPPFYDTPLSLWPRLRSTRGSPHTRRCPCRRPHTRQPRPSSSCVPAGRREVWSARGPLKPRWDGPAR